VHSRRTLPAILAGLLIVTGVLLVSCGGSGSSPSSATKSTLGTTSSGGAQPASVSADSGLTPKGQTVSGVEVTRVVDGDTLHVRLDGDDVTVRMIGMNTPETVKENTPVECYGPEASDYAKKTLSGQTVTLEFDESQGRTDQYGRTLAYIWLEVPGGALSLVNLDEIEQGLARERQYGPTPYAWKSTFKAAASAAREAQTGLWGACPAP
jgi:micrococcal nuclease